MPRQLVVILGMHRSGTSLVTKSIELLGYSLGENLMPAGEDNPTGFWEDLDVVALNDELLASNQASWDSPLDSELIPYPKALQEKALRLLDSKFEGTDKFVVKDPRMLLLLKFWAARFDEAGIAVRYVTVYRQPLDIAASLHARNGLEVRHGLLLTYLYSRALLSFFRSDLFVVGYRQFLEDPVRELSRIAEWLGEPLDAGQAEAFVAHFINPALSHHGHTEDDLARHEQAFPELVHLAGLLSRLAEGQDEQPSSHLDMFPDVPAALRLSLDNLQIRRDFQIKTDLAARLAEQELDTRVLQGSALRLQADLTDVSGRLREREDHIDLLQKDVSRLVADLTKANEVLNERDRVLKGRTQELVLVREELRTSADQIQLLREKEQDLEQQVQGYRQHLEDFDQIHKDLLGSVSFRLGRALTWPIRKPVTTWLLPKLKDNRGALAIVRFLRTCVARPVDAIKLVSLRRIRNFYLLLTDQSNLAEQVVGNYQADLDKTEQTTEAEVHHYSEDELREISLSYPVYEHPVVSVLIPVYNQIDYTLKCLASIREHWPAVTLEVVVADDCSTDATAEVLQRIAGLTVVTHEENQGFLRSCNRAVDVCRGEYVFLLNNDTTVQEGWLDRLVDTFKAHPDAGLVGSKLVYPDGTLQEAGGIVWKDASGWNYGRNGDPDAPEFNYLKEVDYVSGAAIMFPRQLFLELGKFDEHLAPAYYEDTDFAFSVRASGRKVFFQPESVITHYEGKSHGTDENAGIKQNQVINQAKFREKWAEVLDEQHFDNAEQLQTARERSRDKTTVLVIDHYVPHFDKDAGSRSTYQYLQLLVQAGLNVKFLGDNFFKHEPYTTALQKLGIEVLHGRYYERNWERWLRENAGYVDVIYMMRPHIAERYIDAVNQLTPRPRTIYFGHDLHYLRMQRQLELEPDEKLEAEKRHWESKEYELFEKFDLIYYPSQVEVDEILSRQPNLPVKAIPLYGFEPVDHAAIDFSARHGLIFVGGFNHPPNSDGLKWFVDEVYPEILKQLPDILLHIVGSNMPEEIRVMESDNIKVEGFIPDEALAALYRQVRMSVVPLRFGAGIKGKVLEALEAGVPVATTEIGAEGIPDTDNGLLVENDPVRMAASIVALYRDLAELGKKSLAGRKTINDYFSTDAVLKIIDEDFNARAPEKGGSH